MLFNIIFWATSIFQTYIFYLWYQCFLKGIKVSKGVASLAYSVFLLMLTVPYLAFNIPIVTLTCSYAATLLITLIYNGNWKSKILTGTFLMIVMAMGESIVALLTGYIGLETFKSNEYYSIFGTVCLPIFQLLIVLCARNLKNLREGEEIDVLYWTITIVLPLLSVYLFFLFYKQPYIKTEEMILCTGVLLVMNLLVFALYDKQILSYKIKKQNEFFQLQNNYQQNQLQLMHENVERTKRLKHDFLKHISMIEYCINHNENEKLTDYLNEIYSNVELKQKYVDTGNFVIDSIINYKMQEAQKEGVHICSEIKVPEKLTVSVYDLNIILTNLLDNSIEAVKKINDKNVYISIVYTKNRLKIKVRNTYEGSLIKIGNIYETTKKDIYNHGYGLRNVKDVVDKYDGIFEVENNNNTFTVSVCLFYE